MIVQELIKDVISYYKRIPKDAEIFLGKPFSQWDVMEQLTILNYINNPLSQFIELQLSK